MLDSEVRLRVPGQEEEMPPSSTQGISLSIARGQEVRWGSGLCWASAQGRVHVSLHGTRTVPPAQTRPKSRDGEESRDGQGRRRLKLKGKRRENGIELCSLQTPTSCRLSFFLISQECGSLTAEAVKSRVCGYSHGPLSDAFTCLTTLPTK